MPLSKRNRRAVFWLSLLCLFIAYVPRILNEVFSEKDPIISFEALQIANNELQQAEHEREQSVNSNKNLHFKRPENKFDPNTYTLKDWVKLGLSEKQAEVIIKFSKRGLRSNEDLRQIFVFPKELFELVKDSTFYPMQNYSTEFFKPVKEKVYVDLNLADVETLQSIPGIGAFYATKIIEYRKRLGGFIGKEQLIEIWNFDEEKLSEIDPYIYLSSINLMKLNVNTLTVDELKDHPYISYKVANSIVKMRVQQPFGKIEDIKRSKLIDEELFYKLKPYLTVE